MLYTVTKLGGWILLFSSVSSGASLHSYRGQNSCPPSLTVLIFLSTYDYYSALIQLMMDLQYKHELWVDTISSSKTIVLM